MLLSTVDIGSFTDYKDIFYASSDPTTHPDGPHRIFWMRNMALISAPPPQQVTLIARGTSFNYYNLRNIFNCTKIILEIIVQGALSTL